MSDVEVETKQVWLYDHSRSDAVPVTALLIEGTWHYLKNDFVSPLYDHHNSRLACLEAELSRTQETLKRSQERSTNLQGKIDALRALRS